MSHPSHPPPQSVASDEAHKSDNETPALDVSMLKTLAQRALIDVLNSVRIGPKLLLLVS